MANLVLAPVVVEATTEAATCGCGCGREVKSGRSFVQGHDQAHKGNLLKAAAAGDEEAYVELLNRSWKTEEQIEKATARLNRASPDEIDGEVCATCRPLFPRTAPPTRPVPDEDHTPNASSESPPHLRKVVP